jgi:hypothetical protein
VASGVPTANAKQLTEARESVDSSIDERSLQVDRLIWCALIGLLRSRAALEAEILVLRHQLNILRRKSPKRVPLSSIDRLLLVGLYRLAPEVLEALKIIRPETLLRWHRTGLRAYWRWKSRPRGGRPTTPADIRHLIREMSVANPLWGAPRIHGELLKLGIDVGQTTVAKYMAKRRRPPSQGCRSGSGWNWCGATSANIPYVPYQDIFRQAHRVTGRDIASAARE